MLSVSITIQLLHRAFKRDFLEDSNLAVGPWTAIIRKAASKLVSPLSDQLCVSLLDAVTFRDRSGQLQAVGASVSSVESSR